MRLLDDLASDVRHGLRALRREPAVVAGVLLSFTLALGANAALLGLVRRLLLAPPPGVADARAVVRVALDVTTPDRRQQTVTTTSYPAHRALAASGAFAAVGASRTDTLTFGSGEATRRIAVVGASGGWWSALGARPALGRGIETADDRPPAGSAVVVLSHAFWKRAMSGDAGVLGKPVTIDGQPFTVVGIAAPGFNGDGIAPVDAFVPLAAAMRKSHAGWMDEPGMNLMSVVARLKEGVAPGAAATMATAALRAVNEARGDLETRVALRPLAPGLNGEGRTAQSRVLLWLAGVAGVVMLVATANVATLLLLRAQRRRHELAVRVALGVARMRLARMLVTESVMLTVAGAALGLVASRWIAEATRLVLLPGVAPAEGGMRPTTIAAALLAAIVVGGLATLPAAVRAARMPAWREMQGHSRAAARTPRSQRTLVLAQVALSTVLLAGAGLFVRSLDRVRSQDLGFGTEGLLWVTLDFRDALPATARDRVHEDAVRRLTSVPGVTAASVAQGVPFGPHSIPPLAVPGMAEVPNVNGQIPIMYGATPEWLRLMDVRLKEGRLLTERDDRAAPLVVLVNETMARSVWPGQRAVGQCIRVGFELDANGEPVLAPPTLPCREVVGVVADSRARSLDPGGGEGALMQYWVPFAQLPEVPFPDVPRVFGMLVGVTGDVDATMARVQRVVQGTSAVPVYAQVRPYQELIDPQMRSWRLGASLFTALGVLAVAMAAVGLFGVVSYLVTLRTRELGVRHALGGSWGRIAGGVVLDAVRLVGLGVVAGVVLAFLAGPFVEPLLFRTSGRDALVLGGAAVVLLLVAVGAAGGPAFRAGRVSPMEALRGE